MRLLKPVVENHPLALKEISSKESLLPGFASRYYTDPLRKKGIHRYELPAEVFAEARKKLAIIDGGGDVA